MNKQIEKLIQSSSKSDGLVLSAFINLKSVDHSLKKLKSLLIKAKNELEHRGSSIEKIDNMLRDNLVSGSELQLDSGLKDVNIALYIYDDKVMSFKVNRNFEDRYIIDSAPFILPLIRNSFIDVKSVIVNRDFVKVYQFENDSLTEIKADLPLLNSTIDEYDSQALQDRNNDRKDEVVRLYVKNLLDKLFNNYLKREDKVLILSNEECLSAIKSQMELSQWKKNFIVEKHNFPTFSKNAIAERVFKAIDKNKMNHFQPVDEKKHRDYHSLNTIKKEIDPYNIRSFMIHDNLVDMALAKIDHHKDLNQFIIRLLETGIKVSSYVNLKENFTVELKNIQERSFVSQI
ncbi:MAG: hypothetical protein KC478_07715 [Bacteriovoracaceae bacterium]|nr:hypothetical protein [Bacteriovoracaceae bacterium]